MNGWVLVRGTRVFVYRFGRWTQYRMGDGDVWPIIEEAA